MFRQLRGVLKCKKGQMFLGGILGCQIALGVIASLTGIAVTKTAMNGVLQKNGKVIWCKMQGRGSDTCDAQYGHLGNAQYQ